MLSGCSYADVEYNPNYIELYPAINSGWYINADQPVLVLDGVLAINLIEDYRLHGNWLVGAENGDAVLTFTEDNFLFIENELIGQWYWLTPNTAIAILIDGSWSTLRFDYIDGYDDFVQFTEYNSSGVSGSFLAVHE